MNWELIVILCGAILLVTVLKGLQSLRNTRNTSRGSPPGKGYHEIDASYTSGGGGGGNVMHYRVPQDPQEYAKTFVPKTKAK